MGVYDTYGRRAGQLKISPRSCLAHFSVGEEVTIPDGVYLTYANVIVVKDGVFIAEFDYLTDKWGGQIDPEFIIRNDNPVFLVIKSLAERDNEPTQET